MIRFLKNLWNAQRNAADLEDMSYRLSCYLDHTASLSKDNYTLEAMCSAFDERNTEFVNDCVMEAFYEAGLISQKEYSHAVGGIWTADGKLSTSSGLLQIIAVRDSVRKAGHARNAELLDGVIERLEAHLTMYLGQ